MNYLKASGSTRKAFGERNFAALSSGVGLPAQAQCYLCGGTINILTAGGHVTLSAMVVGTAAITLFAHEPCGPSRVFHDENELAAVATQKKPEIAPHVGNVVQQPDGTLTIDSALFEGKPMKVELP